MRIVAVAALGCAVGFALPCAAQTEQAELSQTSTVTKQSGPTTLSRPAAPQLLAPPETALPAPNAPIITHAAPSQVESGLRSNIHSCARRTRAGARACRRAGRSRTPRSPPRSAWSSGSIITARGRPPGACPRRSRPCASLASSPTRRRAPSARASSPACSAQIRRTAPRSSARCCRCPTRIRRC